jgi:hypothetical protein
MNRPVSKTSHQSERSKPSFQKKFKSIVKGIIAEEIA